MLLRKLAEAFAELEVTSGRHRVTDLVAALLRAAAEDELQPVVYLLLGDLRPPYEGVVLGMGEKLLASVLAEAYGASAATVARKLARAGDLGTVAQELAPAPARSRVTVRRAYEALLAVARASGAGAVRRKTDLLVELLRAIGPLEAKYIVRAAQGRLRLGIGEQTILEGTALAAFGDRKMKDVVEHAYNVRSDLGGVVSLALRQGRRALERITPQVGVPVRPALAQRLASAEEIIARLGVVQAEPKYDGFRLQMHRDGDRVWAFSRRLENVTGMFPELTAGVCRQLRAKRAIVEGEAVVYDPDTGEFLPFQVTMTRKRKTAIAESAARHPLRLFAFDVLYANGRDYLSHPQRERSRRLRELLPFREGDPVAVTEMRLIDSAAELQSYFDELIARGLEGIIAKRPDAPYHAGARGYDWVKLKRAYQSKLRDTVDVVLVGYLRGRGKRASLGIGSLLAAVYDPEHDRYRTVAKIGSGLTERGWRELRARLDEQARARKPANVDSLIVPDVWVAPTLVVAVLADEITRSPFHTCGKVDGQPGYALRFPRVLDGIRADKGPTDATTEREVLDLYRLQRAPSRAAARASTGRTARRGARGRARGGAVRGA